MGPLLWQEETGVPGGNFNQITARGRNRTLVTAVRDTCTTTVPPAPPGGTVVHYVGTLCQFGFEFVHLFFRIKLMLYRVFVRDTDQWLMKTTVIRVDERRMRLEQHIYQLLFNLIVTYTLPSKWIFLFLRQNVFFLRRLPLCRRTLRRLGWGKDVSRTFPSKILHFVQPLPTSTGISEPRRL